MDHHNVVMFVSVVFGLDFLVFPQSNHRSRPSAPRRPRPELNTPPVAINDLPGRTWKRATNDGQ
jgi:hypothetical protein